MRQLTEISPFTRLVSINQFCISRFTVQFPSYEFLDSEVHRSGQPSDFVIEFLLYYLWRWPVTVVPTPSSVSSFLQIPHFYCTKPVLLRFQRPTPVTHLHHGKTILFFMSLSPRRVNLLGQNMYDSKVVLYHTLIYIYRSCDTSSSPPRTWICSSRVSTFNFGIHSYGFLPPRWLRRRPSQCHPCTVGPRPLA